MDYDQQHVEGLIERAEKVDGNTPRQHRDAILSVMRAAVRHHNRLYYDNDAPAIPDTVYDRLAAALRRLSPDDPVLREIGNPTFGTKFTHSSMMGSLDKCHTAAEVVAKFGRMTVCVMPKIDGLSLSNHYRNGGLEASATRGDGLVGEVVTPNAARISNLPLVAFGDLVEWVGVEVRGEAYIASGDFYGKMDQPRYDGQPKGYANPRNAAAGGLRNSDTAATARRKVRFVAYKIMAEGSDYGARFSENLGLLAKEGFEVPPFEVLTVSDEQSVAEAIERVRSADVPYDTDGVVVVVDDIAQFEAAGLSGKCPQAALAYKFETEKAASVVLRIVYDTGRTGAITPVAEIEPTLICGSTVSRVTLNNVYGVAGVLAKDVSVGDRILFEKANEIIPKVVKVLERTDDRISCVPEKCPVCDGEVARQTLGDGRPGAHLVCLNDECEAKLFKRIRHMLEKLGVKGIDESTIEKFHVAGLVKDEWDILDLSEGSLVQKGFGAGESRNWAAAMSGIETTPARLLACMGINSWGERMYEILFKASDRTSRFWVDLVTHTAAWSPEETSALQEMGAMPGIKEKKAKAFFDGMVKHMDIVVELLKRVKVVYDEPKAVVGGKLAGKSFCLSGTMPRGKKQIGDDVAAAGGEIKDGVSKGLSYLVAGEGSGSKSDKARKLGVPIITEDDLYAMMG